MIDEVKIFKALSSEQRLTIFRKLYEWHMAMSEDAEHFVGVDAGVDKCFTKACCCMGLSRSTISHHFKELENAGLITCTKNGQSDLCKVNMEAVEAVRNFLT